MEPDLAGGIRADLGALVDLAWGDGGAHSVRTFLYGRLAELGSARYLSRQAAAATDHVIVELPGREPDRRPLVLSARLDLSGASALAGVAALLAAVPAVLASDLERAVVVALFDESAPRPVRPGWGPSAAARGAGARGWFDDGLAHDVKAAVVVGRLVPGRRVAGDDVLAVAGVETDARLPQVLEGVASPHCRLRPTRHVADGLPFAERAIPYLRIGAPALGPTRGHRVDLAAAARLGAHAARLVATLAARLDVARLPGPYGGYDSTDVELPAARTAR